MDKRPIAPPGLGYLEQLRIEEDQYHKEKAQRLAEKKRPLTEKISNWWESLPDDKRAETYTMQWLVNHFGASPSKIGPALHVQGWKRKRCWNPDGPFRRVWVPQHKSITPKINSASTRERAHNK